MHGVIDSVVFEVEDACQGSRFWRRGESRRRSQAVNGHAGTIDTLHYQVQHGLRVSGKAPNIASGVDVPVAATVSDSVRIRPVRVFDAARVIVAVQCAPIAAVDPE